MKRLIQFFLVLVGSLMLLPGSGVAQQLPEPMSPPRLVNDFAGMLSAEQQQALEQKLTEFERQTSTQLAVVTVNDLDGYAPSDYAQRLHDKWGVGGAGKNNGILMLVKPSTQGSRGEAYISVGYGLEGVVPDITAGRILDQEMIPMFRQGDMYAGIDRAADVLMQLTKGEFTADQYTKKESAPGFVFLLILVVLFVLISALNRKKGGGKGNGNHGGGWIPPILMGGGGHRGGGFGGGGFGGFGGGLSGGGGAGRSW